jgi:cytidylate kinase
MNASDATPAYPVIAIDGGAGTGKTTSAALVATRLGFCYVDSGALYRAIAVALGAGGGGDAAAPAFAAAIEAIPLRLEPAADCFHLLLDGRKLGAELRTPEVSRRASQLAVHGAVRARVGRLLREAARIGPLVVEGRDIGTVVFPQATLKVFLSAGVAPRARRRRLDLLRQGIDQSEEEVARDLEERDKRDSTRADAPLREAEEAICLDTGSCTVDEQVGAILRAFHEAAGRGAAAPSESESHGEEGGDGRAAPGEEGGDGRAAPGEEG